jgi:hypothetical protein
MPVRTRRGSYDFGKGAALWLRSDPLALKGSPCGHFLRRLGRGPSEAGGESSTPLWGQTGQTCYPRIRWLCLTFLTHFRGELALDEIAGPIGVG